MGDYGETYQAQLASLVDIIDILPDDMAATCTREIDVDHLADMRAVGVENLPALDTVLYEGQLVLVGGYHRKELWEELEAATVPVRTKQAQNLTDLMIEAYDSNREHGMQWDRGTRTAYALWLYHAFQDAKPDEKVNQAEVAALAGLDPAALSRALKKERSAGSTDRESAERDPGYLSAAGEVLNALNKLYRTEKKGGFFGRSDSPESALVRAKALGNEMLRRKVKPEQLAQWRALAESLSHAVTLVESHLVAKERAKAPASASN
jgi:hypothetical protein